MPEGIAPAPVIALEGLTVRFGRKPILDALTCTLTGRALGLLGPNGAGKSTLIRTLLGFHRPDAGTATILGRDVRHGGKAIRQELGYMPENDSFIPGMSAVRHVRYLAELSGLPAEDAMERAHEALYYVGLGEAKYRKVETYSTGMKQRLKLAQAIVHAPRLLFLDEPTNGLDPRQRVKMIELVREIQETGEIHCIISSHLLRDIEETCDEVLILKEGRIAASCNLEAERRTNRRFYEIEAQGDREGFTAALGAIGCECGLSPRQRLKVVVPESVTVQDLYRVAAEREVQIRRLSTRRDSLEEIFLKAMGEVHGSL